MSGFPYCWIWQMMIENVEPNILDIVNVHPTPWHLAGVAKCGDTTGAWICDADGKQVLGCSEWLYASHDLLTTIIAVFNCYEQEKPMPEMDPVRAAELDEYERKMDNREPREPREPFSDLETYTGATQPEGEDAVMDYIYAKLSAADAAD